MAFVKAIVGDDVVAFPPKIEWLQAWAMMFRCSGTFSNYLGYAKVGCILVKEDTSVFLHAAVKRAKDSVRKAGRFAAREKMWIRGHRIEAILIWAEVGVFIAACMARCVEKVDVEGRLTRQRRDLRIYSCCAMCFC